MVTDIKVLLIEDSFQDAQLIEAIIGSSDLGKPNLSYASLFEEALTMLARESYDLILLDLHLPDGEGLDFIRQLRQQDPETPVLVLTGIEDETVAVASILEGAQDYLIKSDALSPSRLSRLGATNAGNLLVCRIQHAIKSVRLTKSLEIEQARHALTNAEENEDIWAWDLQNNRIYLSPRWQSLLGLCGTPLSIPVEEWIARIHLKDRDRFERTLQDYLEHQQQQIYCEYRIQHAEGHYIWVLTTGKAFLDRFGKAYRIVGSQSDISARKEGTAAIYRSKDLASVTLYAVGAGLLSMQAMLFVNEERYDEAEPLLQGTLEMSKALLGNEHLDVAASLYNLASLYDNQFRFQEAEVLFKESLTIFRKVLGSNHPHTQRIEVRVTMICRLNQTIESLRQEPNTEPNREEPKN